MKRLLFILWIFLLSVSFGLTKMKADVRMPLIFGDHMVLQQDTKIAIFGWADAGETVALPLHTSILMVLFQERL